MRDFFFEGGFGMYPTAFFGLASLLLAAFYALRPTARLLPLIAGLGGASLLAGMLGLVMGLKATIAGINGAPTLAADQAGRIGLAGFSESSNNLLLALVLTILVALALGVGGFRARSTTPAPSVS